MNTLLRFAAFLALALAPLTARAQTGDLSLTDAAVSPSPAESGETVSVDFFVQNLGPGAGQLFSYEILVQNVRQRFNTSPRPFPNVGDFQLFSDSITMPTVNAPTQVEVVVRIVDNRSTANNTERVFVTVRPLSNPDLATDTPAGWSGPLIASDVAGATQTPAVIPGGRDVLVSFGYQNLGPAFTSPTVRTTILLDGFPVFENFYPAMGQGQRRQVRDVNIGVVSAGSHTLELRLDDGNAILESDETNNNATTTFRIGSQTGANLDFSLPSGSSRPAAVFLTSSAGSTTPQTEFQPGDSVFTNLSIQNTGGAASGDFDVFVLRDGVFVESFRQTSIPAGGNAVIDGRPALTNLQTGGTLSFVIDANDEIAESDENDNEAGVTFTVGGECAADYNDDGFVDFFDYTDYVTAFETGGDADFNGDGFVDFFDYSGYVTAFETGC